MNDTPYSSIMVDSEATSGDLLHAFFLRSWQALAEKRRESIFINIREVSPLTVGTLIAPFYSVVGFNASLININAYHQPGVEAASQTANIAVGIQRQVSEFLSKRDQRPCGATEIAREIEADDTVEDDPKICEHLSPNPNCKVKELLAKAPFAAKYCFG